MTDLNGNDDALDAMGVLVVSRLINGRRRFGWELWIRTNGRPTDCIDCGIVDHDSAETALGDGQLAMEKAAEAVA